MCGIVGSINFKLDTKSIDKSMGHRGPDERNIEELNNVSLYHLRLSIQDIRGGKQPMSYQNRYTVIFNGEIYNHMELRKKFDLKCSSTSDTDTLLHLYHKLGVKCFDEFDGMFALCIYDTHVGQLILARDRAGKKPLYVYNDSNKLVFASELNCLKALLSLDLEENSISQYLRLGYMYKSNTPYKNVSELGAGTYVTINVNTLVSKKVRWWNIYNFYLNSSNDDFDCSVSKVDQLLHQAVKRRVESSDLEVGSFLSGGIDSGLVTAIGSMYSPNRLKTFTVSFDGEYDEAPLAKLVANKYNTDHTEIKIDFNNLQNDIEIILGNYGEPFADSSAIPSYYVSQRAKEHLTVILNGDGADEIFGGYRRYVPFSKMDFFATPKSLRRVIGAVNTILPPSNNKKSIYNYIYRLTDFARKSGLDAYLSATTDILEKKHINNGDEISLIDIKKDLEKIVSSKTLSGQNKIMNLDFDFLLTGDLLVKIDIATMAHSLEGRSPFLSKELLEYAPSINDNYKIKGKRTKHILRELSKNYLPKKLLNQPKRGFEIPLKKWVEEDLRTIIMDYLLRPNALYRDYIDRDFTKNLLQGKLNISKEKEAKILWLLFTLEVWHKKHY